MSLEKEVLEWEPVGATTPPHFGDAVERTTTLPLNAPAAALGAERRGFEPLSASTFASQAALACASESFMETADIWTLEPIAGAMNADVSVKKRAISKKRNIPARGGAWDG